MTDDRHTPDPADFYGLTPAEFERLVADLFSRAGYSDVKLVGGPMDQGVDILAMKDSRPFAIQVKHKTRLPVQELQRFTDKYFASPSTPRNLIFVTSAELPSGAASQIERIPEGSHFEVMDRRDLQLMVHANVAASEQAMKTAAQRQRSQSAHSDDCEQ